MKKITTFLNFKFLFNNMKKIMMLLIVFSVFLSACSYSQAPAPAQNQPVEAPASNSAVADNSVVMKDFTFSPVLLTVKKGTTVTWTNQDSAPHTVTSDSGSELSSEKLSNGQSYSHTFNGAGTFEYHCGVHPTMKAKVVVE